MSKMAFVYPGQGVQNPGMGADFIRKAKKPNKYTMRQKVFLILT